MSIPLPNRECRTVLLGSTGSGKTQAAVWLLSIRHSKDRVTVIFDFKRDKLIGELGATEISIFGGVPTKPGLYVVRPIVAIKEHVEALEKFLWALWHQEDVLIFIDEGFMVPKTSKAFLAILTQGRSKELELIICTQRPRWLSVFVLSEAQFFFALNLNFPLDREYVSTWFGRDEIKLLPKYHGLWYDVDGQRGFNLKPVPGRQVLINHFKELLATRRKII